MSHRSWSIAVVSSVTVTSLAVLPGCSASATSQTCAQQYAAWKNGPAHAVAKKLTDDVKKLTSAGQDIVVMTAALKAMGADAKQLQAWPMPACADPAGYWKQYLQAITAAGDNAGSASGLGGILLAEVPLKQTTALQSKLDAELAKAGVKSG